MEVTIKTPKSKIKYQKEKSTVIRVKKEIRDKLAEFKKQTGIEPSQVILAGLDSLKE